MASPDQTSAWMNGIGRSSLNMELVKLTSRAIVTWSFVSSYSVAYHLLMVIVRLSAFAGTRLLTI
jgi:hypothetical protein